LAPKSIEKLAEADAFHGMNLSRRDALWHAKAIKSPRVLPLFETDLDGEAIDEPLAHLPQMSAGQEVIEDYVAMRLSLRAHPVALLRHRLTPA
jgi:error-prone DNA polymerase